jgi:hypothetical protein
MYWRMRIYGMWWDETLHYSWPARSAFKKEKNLTWIHQTLNLKRSWRRRKSLINNLVCILDKFKITFNKYVLWIKSSSQLSSSQFEDLAKTVSERHWFHYCRVLIVSCLLANCSIFWQNIHFGCYINSCALLRNSFISWSLW